MANVYLSQPALLQHATTIEAIEIVEQGCWVTLSENIVRAAGGGQPRDYARLLLEGADLLVADVQKRGGHTWLYLDNQAPPRQGAEVEVAVDGARRLQLSRGHTLTHVLMAMSRQHANGFASRGADIAEDGQTVKIQFNAERLSLGSDDIEIAAGMAVMAGAGVEIVKAKSLEAAMARYPYFRVDPDLDLGGRIRVVHIANIDANPCSGSHLTDIADIGEFRITQLTETNGFYQLSARL